MTQESASSSGGNKSPKRKETSEQKATGRDTSSSSSSSPTSKRRKTSNPSTSTKTSKTSKTPKTPNKPNKNTTKQQRQQPKSAPASRVTNSSSQSKIVNSPSRVLVIDNGGDTVKFGWTTDTEPRSIPNLTARLPQQWTVLVADQLSQIQNPNQLIGVTRSMERGVVVNLGNQVQVWKRVLDILGVNVVATTMNPDTARAFGWKLPPRTASGQKSHQQQQSQKPTPSSSVPVPHNIQPQSCAVLLSVTPFCPRAVLDQLMSVWMHDFGFAHVGFCTSPLISARTIKNQYETACIVDMGWSATHIIPTHKYCVPKKQSTTQCIRRMPLGARHLIKIWQFYCSYRQWNLMDQEFILRDCLEQTSYISLNFKEDMRAARKWPLGLRPYDRDYLLPDYQNTFTGSVRIPPHLEQRLRREQEGQQDNQQDDDDDDDDDDSSDEDVREEDMNEEDIEDDGADDDDDDGSQETDGKNLKQEEGDDDEEDEEDEDTLRQRILKEREEEERRKQLLKEQQQILHISIERFAIPEALFVPSDVGLPREWAGLASAIQQSIQACPDHLHAAMYQSIYLVGGLSTLKNLQQCLESRLRALVPCEYEIAISSTPEPKNHCWYAMQALTKEQEYGTWSISRDEWEAIPSHRGAWRRLAIDHGGMHIV